MLPMCTLDLLVVADVATSMIKLQQRRLVSARSQRAED